MEPLRIDNDVRRVEFLSDCPEGALDQAVRWLEQKDKSGKENAFYFIDIHVENMPEVGWIVSVYCGKPA